jgi:hypothetical protein
MYGKQTWQYPQTEQSFQFTQQSFLLIADITALQISSKQHLTCVLSMSTQQSDPKYRTWQACKGGGVPHAHTATTPQLHFHLCMASDHDPGSYKVSRRRAKYCVHAAIEVPGLKPHQAGNYVGHMQAGTEPSTVMPESEKSTLC